MSQDENKNSNQTLSVQVATSDINKIESETVKVAIELGYVIVEEKEYKVYQ